MAGFDGHLRDLGPVPPALLEPIVQRVGAADCWRSDDPHFLSRHADSQHIVLRFPDRYPDDHSPASYTSLWPDWSDCVEPVIESLSAPYDIGGYGIAKLMLSRLAPGGTIGTHVDENPASQFPSKLHVPLMTNPAVTFTIDSVAYHLERGRAYEVNNLLPHAVSNRSSVPRVHLIFEIYPLGIRGRRTDLG